MLDEPDEARDRGPRPSTAEAAADAARWGALETHLRAVASAAARWETVRVEDGDGPRLAGMIHDIGEAQAALRDLLKRRTMPGGAPSASRRFGAFAGKFAVDDVFLDPLPEAEITAWNGG